MLTKEERAEIAERLKNTYYITNSTLFKALTGEEELIENDQVKELCVIARVILDLCNTSSMIELPLDKDGQVIHIGDTVFDDYGSEWVVNGIKFNSNGVLIDTFLDGNCTKFLPYELTHKQPATIQDLSKRMQGVLEDYLFSVDSNLHTKLVSIADQLKELASKDE